MCMCQGKLKCAWHREQQERYDAAMLEWEKALAVAEAKRILGLTA